MFLLLLLLLLFLLLFSKYYFAIKLANQIIVLIRCMLHTSYEQNNLVSQFGSNVHNVVSNEEAVQ